jgi:hypothetical protein
MDSNADFFAVERIASFARYGGSMERIPTDLTASS